MPYCIKDALHELNEQEEKRLLEEAFEVEEEMIDDDDELSQDTLTFINEFKSFIQDLFNNEDLTENFENYSKLKNHYYRHCIANDPSKKSKRTAVYYDFTDIKDYKAREKYLDNQKEIVIYSLVDYQEVIKQFRKLFEGSFTLSFHYSCGFISNQGKSIKLTFHSYANEATKNYSQNTIDFKMTELYTKTMFPLDANYVETKFNNLINKFNTSYKGVFKINN